MSIKEIFEQNKRQSNTSLSDRNRDKSRSPSRVNDFSNYNKTELSLRKKKNNNLTPSKSVRFENNANNSAILNRNYSPLSKTLDLNQSNDITKLNYSMNQSKLLKIMKY